MSPNLACGYMVKPVRLIVNRERVSYPPEKVRRFGFFVVNDRKCLLNQTL